MKKFLLAGFLLAASAAGCATNARAAFQFTLTQVNNNVVVTGSGTINTAALTLENSAYAGQGSTFIPAGAVLAVDPNNATATEYGGITGPGSWGNGGGGMPSNPSGNVVVISGNAGLLFTPAGYVSGSALSDTMIFTNQTIASLGFTTGTYTYTWGTGVTADSLRVTTAPEPSTWVPLGLGGVGVGVWSLCRRRQRAV